jgi:hypothetical protein
VPLNAYYAEFRPDPLLRRVVFWSGVGLAACGLVAIVSLPWSPVPLTLLAVVWLGRSGWELVRLHRAWKDCRGLRVSPDGQAVILGADGHWRQANLLDGGVLLRRWGWLRFRTESGAEFAEPLRGRCRKSRDWRRLQVIWRHIGAVR